MHSSRVGDKTSAFGKRDPRFGLFSILLIIGIAKASVLPLPVIALPIKSLQNRQKKNKQAGFSLSLYIGTCGVFCITTFL
jgi:hypothetical protein